MELKYESYTIYINDSKYEQMGDKLNLKIAC